VTPPDPTTHDRSAFTKFVAAWGPRVEATLEAVSPGADSPPMRLHEAMRYVLFPGGKRLRPMLALIGCEVTGGDPERALPAAAAIELLHSYSLVHDDLPCMDDDDLRRGRPTCHKVYGEALAVLVGDALLTLAFEVVADGGTAAVQTLARAAGSVGMVGGQVADLESEGTALDEARVAWIHDHKTAALIRASLLVGAHAGGGDLTTLSELAAYGDLVGRAFQIADDCLDLTGTEKNLGKRPGQDLAASKLTYPAVMGLSASRDTAQALVHQAEQLALAICSWAPQPLESARRLLCDAARFTVSRGS
jgi:geranylgeranyl diphosphate synthase, type II